MLEDAIRHPVLPTGGILMREEKKHRCQKKEHLKTAPEECTPEQIKECHGDSAAHPCEETLKENPAEDET